jgi:hypothetical protein
VSRGARIPGTKRRTLFVLPSIPDDLPVETKNAIAVRNACSVRGRCPDCGAHGQLAGPDALGYLHLVFLHERGCDALTDEAA